MEMARRSTQASPLVWILVAGLLSQNVLVVMSTSFEDQKNYYSPDPHAGTGSPPSGSHGGHHHVPSPSHGSGSGGSYGGAPPSHGTPGVNCGNPSHDPHTPSTPSHNPTPSTPSHNPTPSTPSYTPTPSVPSHNPTPSVPSHNPTPSVPSHNPTPSTPSYTPTPSVPSHNPTPSTPSYTPTPSVPSHNPTPSTPSGGGGYYHSPPTSGSPPTPIIQTPPSTPSTPGFTPTPPFIPDPRNPFTGTCNYWRNHPTIIWGIMGWWGTLGSAFGGHSFPGFGSSLSLPQALSNPRTDGFGALYREGTASLLNSMVNNRFPFTTEQVRDSFVRALSSDKAAAAQASLFKRANEGHLKPRA